MTQTNKSKNYESDASKALLKTLEQQLDIQEIQAQKQTKEIKSTFEKMLKETTIKDKRLLLLMEEQADATGEYKERVKALTESYIKEQKDKGRIGKRDSKKLDELIKVQESIQSQQEKERKLTKQLDRKQDLANPFKAFEHAMEDFKESRKLEGKSRWESTKTGAKTLGSGLMESAKQQLTVKNFSKTLIHGLGIGFDLPALNLLADKIGSDIQERKEINKDMFDLNERLVNVSEESSDTLKASKKFTQDEATVLGNQENFVDEIKGLKEVTKDMHKELNNDLTDIYVENSDLTKLFKEYLYLQKDVLDDTKKHKDSDSISSKINDKDTEIKPKDDSSVFDLLDNFGNNDKGKNKGRGGKGRGSKGLNKSPKGMSLKGISGGTIGKVAAPLAALVAGYDKYSEVKDDNELTTAQKTTKVGATAVGAGGGALAGAAAGAAIGSVVPGVGTLIGGLAGGALGALAGTELGDTIGEYMSSFMASDKESTGFVNQLESAGIVKTSWVGDSTVTDWNKVNLLNSAQLEAMRKYDDWDQETTDLLDNLYRDKKAKEGIQPADINEPNIVSQAANINMRETNKATIPSKEALGVDSKSYSMAPPPIVVQSGGNPGGGKSKIDSFKQDDVQALNDRGWGF